MAGEGIQLFIYSKNDPTELLDVLPGREKPLYTDEIGGPGTGSFSININDPRVRSTPSLLEYRNIVRVKVDGVWWGAFKIDKKSSEIISTTEGSEEVINIVGKGMLSFFEDAEVRPFGGLKRNSPDTRYFSFASEPGIWYNPSDWISPSVVGDVFGVTWYGKRPEKFPEKSGAKWLWVGATNPNAPVGTCYFRHTVTIATEGDYSIYVAGDNYMDVYIDGGKVVSGENKIDAYNEATKIEAHFTVGTHYIGFKVTNAHGPAGVAEAIYIKGADNTESIVASSANTSNWRALSYPAKAPGWTPGEIILTLMQEASARGVDFPDFFTPTFTEENDTLGNPWPDDTRTEWQFNIGESLYSVLAKITEMGLEPWITPDIFAFHILPFRGQDRTGPMDAIVFERGKNLTKAASQGVGKIKNSLSVKTADGWLIEETEDETSLSKYGVIEGTLVADVSEALAKNLVGAVFAQRAQAEEGASYEVIVLPNEVPGVDYKAGDWVLAPNDRLESVPRRVMSLTVSETDAGTAAYTIEFDTIFRSNEEYINKVLGKGGKGLSNGFSTAIGNPSFNAPIVVTPGGPSLKYPKAPTGLAYTSSGYWSADGMTAYSEVVLTWNDVTENTDETPLIPSGYIVHGRQADTGWQVITTVTDNTVTLRGFVPDDEWQFRLQTIGDEGATSVFSTELDVVPDGPNAPMDAPDAPTLDSSMGLLQVNWNGLLDGIVPPPQFRYVYAEVAPDVSGSPGTFAVAGSTLGRDGGSMSIPGLIVGEDYWVHLFAVDGAGIASAASDDVMQSIIGVDLGDLDDDVTDAIEAARQAAFDAKSTVNLLEDDSFELNTEEFWDWNNTNVTNVTTAPRTGARHLRLASTGSSYEALRYNRILKGDPADSFLFRFFYRNSSGVIADSQDEGMELAMLSGPTEASVTTETLVTYTAELQATGYQLVQGTFVLPAGHFFFKPIVYVNDTTGTNVYYIDDIRVLRMTGVSLLVDGAVIADKIGAGVVTAVHMSANSIAASSIQAEAITAEKLAVDSVTANAIQAGAIETDHISAGAIEVTHLAPSVGDQINIAGNVVIQSVQSDIAGVGDDLDDTNSNLAEMQTYYSFGPTGALISTPASAFATAIRNDRIEMLENGNVISYWNSGQLVVDQLVANKLRMGTHQVESRVGGTIVRYVG